MIWSRFASAAVAVATGIALGAIVAAQAPPKAPAKAPATAARPAPKGARPAAAKAPKAAVFFTTPLTPAEMAGKQAVVETTAGTFVIDLLPDAAPTTSATS